MKKIVLVGAGGHCRSVIDVIEQEGKYQIVGLIDLKEKIGQEVLGYKIIASDQDLDLVIKSHQNFCITVGQIKSSKVRAELFEKILSLGGHFPTIVSPHAYVSQHASIGAGTVIMHHALINAGSKIGKNCIINSKALCEHDTIVEDHCHISTGAILNGDCKVQAHSFVGSNTVLKQSTTLPSHSIITFGSKV